MNESPQRRRRSSSASRHSPFQVHASQIVKKIGALTIKLGVRKQKDLAVQQETGPYRQSRSMDVLRKPFMSQPMLTLTLPQDNDRSPSPGTSISNEKSSPGDVRGSSESKEGMGEAKDSYTMPLFAWECQPQSGSPSSASAPSASPQGICKHSASSPSLSQLLNPSRPQRAAGDTPGPSPSTTEAHMAVACRSSPHSQHAQPTPSSTVTLNADAIRKVQADSVSSKRPLPHRLASLPPLMTAHLIETADHRLRLSPSVIVRHPQHPILNLPTLPPPTPVSETPRTPRPRLNTMPCLPMQGQEEEEDDPDHEHADMADEDEEDGDDYEDVTDERGAAPGFASEDDDVLGDEDDRATAPRASRHQHSVSLDSGESTADSTSSEQYVPTSSIASILALLDHTAAEDSTSTNLSFSHTDPEAAGHSSTSSSGSALAGTAVNEREPESESLATPKVYRNDYFTNFAATVDTRDEFTSPPTPTARIASGPIQSASKPQPRTQVSDAKLPPIHTVPGSSQRLQATTSAITRPSTVYRNDSPRPGLYHQASKSMVDLFPSREFSHGPINFDNRGSRVYADAKGKRKDSEFPSLHGEDEVPTASAHKRPSDTNIEDVGGVQGAGQASTQDTSLLSVPAPALRRRSSMPTFTSSGPPPPYPSFLADHHLKRFKPSPRDEEGHEQLPAYTNDINLIAVMPRKMEFTAPGTHAKDRKWRRVQCVLEGTVFKVYRCPTKVAGVGVIGGWWEKKVGVGDVALMGGTGSGAPTTVNGQSRASSSSRRAPVKWEREQQQMEASPVRTSPTDTEEQDPESVSLHVPPHRSKKHLAATFLHPNRSRVSMDSSSRCHSRTGSSTPSPSPSPLPTPRSSLQIPRPSSDSVSFAASYASQSNTAASSSTCVASQSDVRSRSHLRTHSRSSSGTAASPLPSPNPKDLLREYSLQNAESGLASDYFKRKNVIRVRMEGEQFLLQATDIAGVIEWIEGLQAATNIALDLDERPMPKGPIFPRRRRRRRVRVNPEDPQIGVQITDTS